MTEYLSIREAAKTAHTTMETLRHYDRIGLVKPSKKDALIDKTKTEYGIIPPFIVQIDVVSGVLHRNDRIQIPLCG